MTISVGIYLFPDVEVLDFAGPYEVFSAADRVGRRQGAAPLFRVFTVARKPGPVRARAGLVVQPDYVLAEHPAMDVLVVPGGVIEAELECPEVSRWIAAQHAAGSIVASVCTGVFLVARTGLLDGLAATTHHEDAAQLQAMFPAILVMPERRWIDHGTVVSSAGIAAGMDMSLHLVGRLTKGALATATARQLALAGHEPRAGEQA